MDYNNKVVWITGASSGIGEYLAYALSAKGAKLALSARNEAALARVREQCAHPEDVLIVPLDVTDFDRIPTVAQQILDQFGYINILINNAGVSQRDYAKDTDLAVDQKVMNINYFGSVAVTKAVLPDMLRQRFGHIVVMSSVLGVIGTPLRSAYAAAKHALHGFYDSLRAEVHEDNIKVTILLPGFVNTDVAVNALKGDGSKNLQREQAGIDGLQPDEFAEKALRVIAAGKNEVYIGGIRERAAILLKRFLPNVLAKILVKAKVN